MHAGLLGAVVTAIAAFAKIRFEFAWLIFPLLPFGMIVWALSLGVPDGLPDNVEKSYGIWVGLALSLPIAAGGLYLALLGESQKRQEQDAQVKKCPQCAEPVLADAKVRKHCGHGFSAGGAG